MEIQIQRAEHWNTCYISTILTHLMSFRLCYIYYISSNGSDESTCGDTGTACRTIEHVLYLFFNKSGQTGLEIITSKSLVIDQRLMVRLFLYNISILFFGLFPVIFFHKNKMQIILGELQITHTNLNHTFSAKICCSVGIKKKVSIISGYFPSIGRNGCKNITK